MAIQRRPRKEGRLARAGREEARRSGEIASYPEPATRRGRGAAAAGAAAGGATFGGGSAAAMLGILASGGIEAATVEKAAKAFLATLASIAAVRLARERESLSKAGYEPNAIDAAIAKERELEVIYQRRAAERFRAALRLAASAPDASASTAAVNSALRREQNYSRQRSLASGARVFSSIAQTALEAQSPLGAFWKLGVAAEHTPDCVAMAEKFWPWEVLRRIHPLLHVGCKCKLYSYGEAVAAGWMSPSDVMSLPEAERLAGPVIDWVERHHAQENEALAELLMREEMAEIEGTDANFLAASPLRADAAELKERFDPAQKRDRRGRWANECSICALSNLSGISFSDAQKRMEELGWKPDEKSPTAQDLFAALHDRGKAEVAFAPNPAKGDVVPTAREWAAEAPNVGRFAIFVPGHVMTLVNGKIDNPAGQFDEPVRFVLRYHPQH